MSDSPTKEQDIHTDSQLIERWVVNRSRKLSKRGGDPLWFVVSEAFAIGSTSAQQVCRRHGVDPDRLVKKS